MVEIWSLEALKRHLARQLFRHIISKKAFPLIKGRVLQRLSEAARGRVEFQESICNAGLVPLSGGYTCVAKNQRFSYCNEIGTGEIRNSVGKHLDDGVRALYRIDFDGNWHLRSIQRLRVIVDGQSVDPVMFVEDVRLVPHENAILSFANGYGAWPLLGTLKNSVITLRSAVANFSAPQKNWMPFEYDNCLYLEYSIQPHVILKFDLDSAKCTEAYRTTLKSGFIASHLHGGAPPLRLNENYFLGVGNSQHLSWFQDRYYAAVFYLFEAKPPFRVVKATPPIRFQSRVERIQYVCGLAFGEDKQSLILSIGICDCDNVFVLVSLDQVLANLKVQNVTAVDWH